MVAKTQLIKVYLPTNLMVAWTPLTNVVVDSLAATNFFDSKPPNAGAFCRVRHN